MNDMRSQVAFHDPNGPRAPLRSNFDDPNGWEPPESPSDRISFPTSVVGQTGEVLCMDPVACRPIIKCRKTGLYWFVYALCGGTWVHSWEEASHVQDWKTFSRPNVTLSDFLPARSDNKKRNSSRHASPAISQRSSWVSWSDSVLEDCAESRQAEINKKIKANDKLRKILTNMLEERRVLVYGDNCRSKMQSLEDEKAALLAAERQFLPLQSWIEKTEELSGASRKRLSKQQKRLEILKNGWRQTSNWKQPTPFRPKPNTRCRFWWPNKLRKTPKLSIKGIPVVHTHGRIHSRPSSTTKHSLSVQIRYLDAKHGVPQCFGTAHGGQRDG